MTELQLLKKRGKKSQINNPNSHLKKLERVKQTKPTAREKKPKNKQKKPQIPVE